MEKLKKLLSEVSDRDKRLIELLSLLSFVLVVSVLTVLYFVAENRYSNLPPEKDPFANLRKDSSTASDSARDSSSLFQIPDIPPEKDLQAHRKLMDLYRNMGTPEEALEHIERIAPFMEDDLSFQTSAGRALLNSGKAEEALQHLDKALALSPGDPKLVADQALAQFRSGAPLLAIKKLQKACKRFPNDLTLKTHLGTFFAEIDPTDKRAEKIFDEVLSKEPGQLEASYQKSRQFMNQGNFGSALAVLEKLVRSHPLDARIRGRLGMTLYALSKWDRAERELRKAVAINDRDYNSWYTLGELHLSRANQAATTPKVNKFRRRAYSAFAKALEYDPGHTRAHYRIGLLMNGNRQYREAIRYLSKALEGNSRSVPVLLQLSIAYEAVGRKEDARERLMQAYAIEPFNRVIAAKLKSL